MDIFKEHNLLEFAEQFNTDENYKEYLAQIRRQEDYFSRKYSNKTCQIRKCFHRPNNSNFTIHLKSYFRGNALYR